LPAPAGGSDAFLAIGVLPAEAAEWGSWHMMFPLALFSAKFEVVRTFGKTLLMFSARMFFPLDREFVP
jgi:hypothetical protein